MNDAMMKVYQAGLERIERKTTSVGVMSEPEYQAFMSLLGESEESYDAIDYNGVPERVFKFALRRDEDGNVLVEQPNVYKTNASTVEFLKKAAKGAMSNKE